MSSRMRAQAAPVFRTMRGTLVAATRTTPSAIASIDALLPAARTRAAARPHEVTHGDHRPHKHRPKRKSSLPTLPKARLDVEHVDGVVIHLGGVNGYKKVKYLKNMFQGCDEARRVYTKLFNTSREAALALARK
jgi:hypothetical protein